MEFISDNDLRLVSRSGSSRLELRLGLNSEATSYGKGKE